MIPLVLFRESVCVLDVKRLRRIRNLVSFFRFFLFLLFGRRNILIKKGWVSFGHRIQFSRIISTSHGLKLSRAVREIQFNSNATADWEREERGLGGSWDLREILNAAVSLCMWCSRIRWLYQTKGVCGHVLYNESGVTNASGAPLSSFHLSFLLFYLVFYSFDEAELVIGFQRG